MDVTRTFIYSWNIAPHKGVSIALASFLLAGERVRGLDLCVLRGQTGAPAMPSERSVLYAKNYHCFFELPQSLGVITGLVRRFTPFALFHDPGHVRIAQLRRGEGRIDCGHVIRAMGCECGTRHEGGCCGNEQAFSDHI